MANSAIAENNSGNGNYKFDAGTVRVGVGAVIIGLLLFGSLGVWGGVEGGFVSKGPILCFLFCLGLLMALLHIASLSGRTLRIDDSGIWVRDKHGSEIGSLHWSELGKVTERRRMAQLALWDKTGTRRVLVDQQYRNFGTIRARILAEYQRVFSLKSLPIELRRQFPPVPETLLFGFASAFFCWAAWASLRQHHAIASAIMLSFTGLSLLSLLNLYPLIAGPSELFGDRLVLRTPFKTEEIYKGKISSVELADAANPRSGTKFSQVIVKTTEGKTVKIGPRFGSVPELYLTLRAWLAQSRS